MGSVGSVVSSKEDVGRALGGRHEPPLPSPDILRGALTSEGGARLNALDGGRMWGSRARGLMRTRVGSVGSVVSTKEDVGRALGGRHKPPHPSSDILRERSRVRRVRD